jgi:hypothetical protein
MSLYFGSFLVKEANKHVGLAIFERIIPLHFTFNSRLDFAKEIILFDLIFNLLSEARPLLPLKTYLSLTRTAASS